MADGDFSTGDRLRALCNPFACCLPSCRLVSTSDPFAHDGDGEDDAGRDWFNQSRGTTGGEDWDNADATAQRRRRESDMLSLHEPSAGINAQPRRRYRRRGGDVSGSGADWGSGLSRWTLLKSWWSGRGPVRLPDTDDEEDGGEGGERNADEGDVDVTVNEGGNTTLMEGEGEGDAIVLSSAAVIEPPPPSSIGSPTRGSAYASSERGDFDDHEARKARRRARRAARELGVTVEEYAAGQVVDPEALTASPLLLPSLDPTPRRSKKKASSHSSSTDSRDLAALDGQHARSGRRHRNGGSSYDSANGRSAGSDHGSASSSRTSGRQGERSRSTHQQMQQTVPLPSSPSTSSHSHLDLPPIEHKRPRHRSMPSTSTDSTTSSSGQHRRRRKHKQHVSSPLEEGPYEQDGYGPDGGEQFAPSTSPSYFQDEHGQLQPHYDGAVYNVNYDTGGGQMAAAYAETYPYPSPNGFKIETAVSPSYEHIGTLPSAKVEAGAQDWERAEERVEEPDGE